MQRSRKFTIHSKHKKGILWKKLSIYHHAKSNEHIVFDMKTPFNGKMVFFAAISLHTLIVMSEFVTFYENNWMKNSRQTKSDLFVLSLELGQFNLCMYTLTDKY